jgi:HD-like signal output (HDOD) protein
MDSSSTPDPPGPATARVERLVHFVLDRAERNSGDLPAFPGVATRLVDLLEHPEASLHEVEALVSQDPAVSSQLLRVANSLMYRGAMPIETVPQAVIRLGFRETAQVAMTAACRVLFSLEDRAELEIHPALWRSLWLDSLLGGYGGRLLSRELKRGQPDRIFLAAMFRNLGSLLILKIVARALVRGRLPSPPTEAEMRDLIDVLHPRLGATYLRRCRLPDHVPDTAARHHRIDLPCDDEHVDLHVVRLADGLVDRIGLAPFATGSLGPLTEESAAFLDVSPERLEYFELQFRELAGQLEALS